jgi:putative zinc finger/helix-turn-helix YgiT family protein
MSDQPSMSPAGTRCPVCENGVAEPLQRTAQKRLKSGTVVSYTDELSRCRECGEEFYTYEQSRAHSQALSAAVRQAEGLFAPAEIRRLRIRLSMTQEQFERALGVGRKTVVRWERGTVVPSRAANALLWIADRYPSVFAQYASERLVREGETRTEISRRVATVIESTGSPVTDDRVIPGLGPSRHYSIPATLSREMTANGAMEGTAA